MSNQETTFGPLAAVPQQPQEPPLPPPPGGPDGARRDAAGQDIERLKARISARLESGKLTQEQGDQALRVVDSVGDPAILDKFLKNGGVALLAKLDGLPAQEQRELAALVAKGKAQLHTINEFLDKYHDPKNVLGSSPEERHQKLRDFIDSAEQIGDAAKLSSLMQAGGVAKVISTASGISSGGGGSVGVPILHAAAAGSGVSSGLQPAQMVQQLEGIVRNIAQAFSTKSSLSAMLRAQQIEQALTQLSNELLEARKKKEKEDAESSATSGIWPSKQAAEDLQVALRELSEIAGPGVTAPLRQLVQVLNRGDQLGMDFTIDQLLALLSVLKQNELGAEAPEAPKRTPPPNRDENLPSREPYQAQTHPPASTQQPTLTPTPRPPSPPQSGQPPGPR